MRWLLIFLTLGLLGCAASLPPAGPAKEMIDQADTAILATNKTPDEEYQNFASYLSQKGFTFDNSDEVIRVLKTDLKEYEGSSSFQYRINVSISSDSTTLIRVNGDCYLNMLGEIEAENRGQSGSPVRKCWEKVLEIAEEYPHEEIYYSRN